MKTQVGRKAKEGCNRGHGLSAASLMAAQGRLPGTTAREVFGSVQLDLRTTHHNLIFQV